MAFICFAWGALAGILAHRAWLDGDPAKKKSDDPLFGEQVAAVETLRAYERNPHDGNTHR